MPSVTSDPRAAPSRETAAGDAKPCLKKTAVHASFWTMFGYGGMMVLRLGGNLVLARIFLPEAFGLMGLVTVLMHGLQMFSDVGLGTSVIQNRRGHEEGFLNTVWTLKIIRGFILWTGACVLAYPYAVFYGEPQLIPIIGIMSFSTVFGGLKSTNLFMLNRDLKLRLLMTLKLLARFTSLSVTILLALWTRSLWAFVAGSLTFSGLELIFSHTVIPGPRNRFHLDTEHSREILQFGGWIFVSSIITFFAGQADRLLFGKLITMTDLGVYFIGLNLATAPSLALGHLSRTVVFPVFSRLVNEGEGLSTTFQRVRAPLLTLGGWCCSVLIAAGPALVRLLYNESYHGATWIVQVLAVGSWFVILEATNSAALLGSGRSSAIARCSASKFIGIAGLVPFGFWLWGFPGALVGVVASDLAKLAVSSVCLSARGLRSWVQDLRLSGLVAASVAVGWAAGELVEVSELEAVTLPAAFVVVSMFWLPLGAAQWRAYRNRRTES